MKPSAPDLLRSLRHAPCAMRRASLQMLGGMRDRKGFTLIEVLVAVVLLGIGLTIILELFSGGLRSVRLSEEYTRAVWYGREKMEEMLVSRELSEGVTEGTFDPSYSWKIEVKKSNPLIGQGEEGTTTLPIELYQIIVTVTWPSGARQRSLEIESLRTFKGEQGEAT
jgi:general secretion pathway protein I